MYYPKNKIKNNLVSTEGEYIITSNNQPYLGFYYKLSNGKAYTGRFPGDGVNLLLTPTPDPFLTTPPPTPLTTTSIPPLYPTPKDYEYGMFIRYFSKKRNEYLFEELTQDQYNELNTNKNPRYFVYKPFYIKWMLTGNVTTVSNFNRYSILNAEGKEQVYGLNEFLKMNYIQYYQFPSQDNLYTNGGEFKTPDGIEYIGPYHIHPDKGPMVGATHSTEPHSILIPIITQSKKLQLTSSQINNNIFIDVNNNYSGGGGSSGGGGYGGGY